MNDAAYVDYGPPIVPVTYSPLWVSAKPGFELYWKWNDPRWGSWGLSPETQQYPINDLWEKLIRQAGFKGEVYKTPINYFTDDQGNTTQIPGNTTYTPEAESAIDALRARGFDLARKHPDRRTYNTYWGLFTPDGQVRDIKIEGDDGWGNLLKIALFLSPVWAGPLASLLSVPTPVVSLGTKLIAGQDPVKAVVSTLAPIAVDAVLPAVSVLPDTSIGPILPPAEWLDAPFVGPVMPGFGPDFMGPVLPTVNPGFVVPTLPVTDDALLTAELLTAPALLPELDPIETLGPTVIPPPPVYEPPPVLVYEPEPLPFYEPEPLPIFEPEPVQFEPVPVVELPAIETMAPIPTIDAAPPTIEPVEVFTQPVEVPKMDDDEFYWRGAEVEAPAFDVDFSDPFAGVEVDFWEQFEGVSLVGIPGYGDDIYTTAWDADPIYGPPAPGETYPPAYDVVTVDDAAQLSADILVGGSGGGLVEVGGNFAPNPNPGNPGLSVGQVLRDANGIMLEALKLVDSYRRLVNPQPPNRVTQARVGSSTVRATPDGMIVTVDASGRTVRTKPPVGQPQMTTDGSMIVNNGDGTYTSISPSGAMATNRYPTTGAAAASSNYTTPLLIGGAILAIVALTR